MKRWMGEENCSVHPKPAGSFGSLVRPRFRRSDAGLKAPQLKWLKWTELVTDRWSNRSDRPVRSGF